MSSWRALSEHSSRKVPSIVPTVAVRMPRISGASTGDTGDLECLGDVRDGVDPLAIGVFFV